MLFWLFIALAFFFAIGGIGGLIRPPPGYGRKSAALVLGVGLCMALGAFGVRPRPAVLAAAAKISSSAVDHDAAISEIMKATATKPEVEPGKAEVDYRQHGAERVAAYRDHVPLGAPGFGICGDGDELCRINQYNWATQDWAHAHNGDVEAIRNVANCLSTSCEGAVMPNRVQGCAWRMVVIDSGSAVVTENDARAADEACGPLDQIARVAAVNRAAELAHTIPRLYEPE
jgi:hypothetical protein